MKRVITIFVACFNIFSITFSQTTTINLGTTNVEAKNIYTSPGLPWELKYGPGDSLWMTTRNGIVYRINTENGMSTQVLDHSANVIQSGESGMLAMAFHPNFATNPLVYIVYTYLETGNIKVRLSRFTYSNNSLVNEEILLQNIAGNTTHDGSRLLVLADNTLLMTTGDAQNLSLPQNTTSLNGKVLRLNLDGTVPANNPIAGSYVYGIGHRNAQGLMQHPNGKIYLTEHGPDSNDEFQIIEAGRNYGWPNVYGFCDNDIANETTFCTANNVKEPLASWNVIPGGTWAPNDLIWYDNAAIPEFQNSFLVTFLKTNKIRRIQMNAAGDAIISQTDFFVNQWGRLRDITTAPNGDIFIATNSSPFKIIRVRNLSILPVVFSAIRADCSAANINVHFTASASENIKKYSLFVSNDGVQFNEAAEVKAFVGAGIAHNYSFLNLAEFTYFKIVSEDVSGNKISSVIETTNCSSNQTFKLSPNPATNSTQLNISIIGKPFIIQVFNNTGSKKFHLRTNKSTTIPVNGWATGIYIVTVTNEEGQFLYKEKLLVH